MQVFTQFDKALEILWTRSLANEPVVWPFLTFPWHHAWHRHFGEGERLAIFAEDGIIAPLAIRGHVAHFTGGEEIADYLDSVGPADAKLRVWQHVISSLHSYGVTSLTLRNIPDASPTRTLFKHGQNGTVSEEDSTPTLALPQSVDQYRASLPRKARHELKRKMKRFEEQYPAVTFTRLPSPDIERALDLMRRNTEKTVFLTPAMQAFFRELPRMCSDTFEQYALLQNGVPVATVLAFRVGTSLLLYNSGYAPNVIGSGWYLKARLILQAIEEGLTSINFLQGRERYKYEFGATDVPVHRMDILLSGEARP